MRPHLSDLCRVQIAAKEAPRCPGRGSEPNSSPRSLRNPQNTPSIKAESRVASSDSTNTAHDKETENSSNPTSLACSDGTQSRRSSEGALSDPSSSVDEPAQPAHHAPAVDPSSTEGHEAESAKTLTRTSSATFLAICKEQPLQTRGRLERWELAPKDVQIKQRLGQGDGGVIHLAKWRGLMCVAKMLHQDETAPRNISSKVARQDLVNEISLISHLRHPALVLFLGACTKSEPVIILSEFMAGGNLEDFIAKTWQRQQQWNPPPDQVLRRIPGIAPALSYLHNFVEVLRWITGIARALSFLHNCVTPIIHRDLKPSNLLLDQHGHIKAPPPPPAEMPILSDAHVCDFGLSRMRSIQQNNGTYRMTGKTGSLRYMAPEVFNDVPTYDEKVDLYSFAMIMWYIITESPLQ
ncbi:kinase-like domain-containing protein [Baffinella frigidus]|nr:kinase-like domain-containing protein [Cryptophyta sp. CCMP2293]